MRLNDAQKAQLDAGTHVMDPVHGFVPKVPIGSTHAEGKKVVTETIENAPGTPGATGIDEAARLKAEGAAVKESQKEQR